jgi:hypothetical protein
MNEPEASAEVRDVAARCRRYESPRLLPRHCAST